MAEHKVRAPDGRVITVTAPDGASHEDIIKLARQQRPTAMAEKVAPGSVENPYARSTVGSRLKDRAPDLAAAATATMMPGSGLLGLAARTAGAEVAGDIGDIATTGKMTPGYHGGAQLFGEGVSRAIRPVFSPATYRAFANRTAKSLADTMKDLVPAWGRFSSNHDGLYEMAHGTGQRVMSQAFDTAIGRLKPLVTTRPVMLPMDDIRALHLTPTQPLGTGVQTQTIQGPAGQLIQVGEVSASDLIDGVTGVWKRNPALYRRSVKALTHELDQMGGLGREYAEAREAYKNGAGFIEMAEKGAFLYGERFDPAKAAKALDKYGKLLTRRGMDEVRSIIRGPGDEPVKAVKQSELKRGIPGLMIGEGVGHHMGVPWWISGPAGAAASRGVIPATTYTNVPLTPLGRFATQVVPAVGTGAALREGVRDFDLRDQLPAIEVSGSARGEDGSQP